MFRADARTMPAPFPSPVPTGAQAINRDVDMKVTASVKPRCDKCRVIKRKGVIRIICVNARHSQRQG